MDYDYSKRGYLLPPGCKDLADLLKPKAPALPNWEMLRGQISVLNVAFILGVKPYEVIAGLMGLGVFATVHQEISFELAAEVARKHGYIV